MANLFPNAPTYADPIIVDPQTGLASFNPLWLKWFLDIVALLSSFGGGSGGVDHALLSNLNSGTYSHLTAAQLTDLTDAGDSALHYHATDRARANHTGTQLLATISDAGSAAAAATTDFDAAGAAATVQGNLNTHTSDTSNPHSVTAAQVGAISSALVAARISMRV